jgi:hypothetical protein
MCIQTSKCVPPWSRRAMAYHSTRTRAEVAAWNTSRREHLVWRSIADLPPYREFSSSISRALTFSPRTVSSPMEMGNLNRRGPQLPGFK